MMNPCHCPPSYDYDISSLTFFLPSHCISAHSAHSAHSICAVLSNPWSHRRVSLSEAPYPPLHCVCPKSLIFCVANSTLSFADLKLFYTRRLFESIPVSTPLLKLPPKTHQRHQYFRSGSLGWAFVFHSPFAYPLSPHKLVALIARIPILPGPTCFLTGRPQKPATTPEKL